MAVLMGSGVGADAAPSLQIQLNTADLVGESCRLTFVLTNSLGADVDQLVVETVLFSADGGVVLLTLFDFAAVPAGRPRVRQFQVPDTSCARIGQVLVNGISTCSVDGASSDICAEGLAVSSRIEIELEG